MTKCIPALCFVPHAVRGSFPYCAQYTLHMYCCMVKALQDAAAGTSIAAGGRCTIFVRRCWNGSEGSGQFQGNCDVCGRRARLLAWPAHVALLLEPSLSVRVYLWGRGPSHRNPLVASDLNRQGAGRPCPLGVLDVTLGPSGVLRGGKKRGSIANTITAEPAMPLWR